MIHFLKDNERAGLWNVCNKTQQPPKRVDVQDRIETSTLTTKSLAQLGIDVSLNLTTKPLLSNPTTTTTIEYIETCYSKFFLKEGWLNYSNFLLLNERSLISCLCPFQDGHLVFIILVLVTLLFHFSSIILMLIGLLCFTTHKRLYFYHSAGECLISSGIFKSFI